ncbi:uncharacterized protein LOC129217694 [Uloborus diversus]|uniref:uncharacterized protein LOC129217694 n=1 Tax=Uloborus diversus TaxID=327109 RepID=UPI00240A4B69|nr:uncharacterized protein LOC129217694 [Uloborus diversus]XP_054708004.1 uncharacterized protein LOC129217694 [Uloborus diversus]
MLFEDRVLYHVDGGACSPGSSLPGERLPRRWPRTDPSRIWIPSRLLPNRSRRDQDTKKSAFHMLQRYESRDFENSFSVYSDSDEEYFHDYAKSSKAIASTGSPAGDGSSKKSMTNGLTDSSDRCSYQNLVVELPPRRLDRSPLPTLEDILVIRSTDELSDLGVFVESTHPLVENGEMDRDRDSPKQNCDRGSPEGPAVIEAEFAYHKKKSGDDPSFERKVGSKREKRNKTRAKITMPLDHFHQAVDSDGIPEEDAFYESVVGGKNHRDNAREHVAVDDVREFPELGSFWGEGAPPPRGEEEVEVRAEGVTSTRQRGEGEEEVGGRILVVADIPEDVDREMVVDLVSDYGQLLEMETCGGFSKAEFWIPPDVELDWLISCFDGHQPFGAYSTVLHCYEKES